MANSVDVEFVDGVQGSTSLSLVAAYVRQSLARQGGSLRTRTWLDEVAVRVGLRSREPALVLFLAHYLGRSTLQHRGLLRSRRRALLAGWEIEQLTASFTEELAAADVLLGISEFNSEVFRTNFPDTPVITVPVCPPLPDHAEPDRQRWGLPAAATIFLTVFDPVSGFDRKNPLDVHTAFTRAFPDREDVRLVFKVHGGFAKNPDEGDLEGEEERAARFIDLCATDARVVLLDEFLCYDDLMSLVVSCDAYVSLARAEGLGLPVLEAMTLGVPTICTGYSGHLAFAGPESSLLVDYDLIDVGEAGSHYYHPRAYNSAPMWAQPDVEQAARHMRRLADDAALRETLSKAGRQAAAAYRDHAHTSTWVEELTSALASPGVGQQHARRDREWRRVVDRDRAIWRDHEIRVRRARRVLSARTRMGRAKRYLLRRASPPT